MTKLRIEWRKLYFQDRFKYVCKHPDEVRYWWGYGDTPLEAYKSFRQNNLWSKTLRVSLIG